MKSCTVRLLQPMPVPAEQNYDVENRKLLALVLALQNW